MTTKIIGLKDFRQNLSAYTKQLLGKDVRFIVLNKNKPVMEVNPMKSDEFILEELIRDAEIGRKQIKEGKVYTLDEVKKHLKLGCMNRRFELVFTEKARDHLDKLDKNISNKILEKLYFYKKSPDPFMYAKRIKDVRIGQYRFRVGDYRAIFEVQKYNEVTILNITQVKHRRDVYKFVDGCFFCYSF
ncbi:type II toxin-antitoxin system RelE/ParE family toxin [Candidatus Gracilibacteria bacterium]|nr:type II toxin-antitoxin system RelE/ParE family toxin [Candidatus Gracilibacteria bacterium]